MLGKEFAMSRMQGLRVLLVCSGLFLMSMAAPAQTKVAVINIQRAVLESDEIQKASAAMEARYKPRQQEI
jgi:Skp family chaperone for outer membrane proteins